MPQLPTTRSLFGLVFLAAVALMIAAFVLEHVWQLKPCPLCISQRIALVFAGLAAGIAWLHHPARGGLRIWGTLIALFALAGAALAGRQVWLQSLPPDRVPACGPDVSYILEVFPWQEALALLLRGDGNCAEIDWTFLGLSIAGWTLPAFILIALIGLSPWWRKR